MDSRLYADFIRTLLPGAYTTLRLTMVIFPLGMALSAAIAFARVLNVRWLARLCVAYVELFRATPALMHLFYIFYVLPFLGISLPPFPAAILALTLTFGAYNSEVIRGAILAVPRGQWDAARVLGMSRFMTIRRVILPQAIALLVPPLTNSLIELVKNTSLASLVSVHEIVFLGQRKIAETYRAVDIYLLIGAFFFGICYTMSRFSRWFESRRRVLL